MKKKVSTLVDPAVFGRIKMEALIQDKQISEIIGEALEQYLRSRGSILTGSVAASSWGALRLESEQVQQILDDEDGLWDG